MLSSSSKSWCVPILGEKKESFQFKNQKTIKPWHCHNLGLFLILESQVFINPIPEEPNTCEDTWPVCLATWDHSPGDNARQLQGSVLIRASKGSTTVTRAGRNTSLINASANHSIVDSVDTRIIFLAVRSGMIWHLHKLQLVWHLSS